MRVSQGYGMSVEQAPGVKRRQAIVDFLGLKKNMLVLLTMVVLVGLGEKMAERFLPLYLVALGGGAFSVGLLNGMDNLLSALYSYPGGYASDRLGYKRALILFNLIAMLGYLTVIIFPYWQAVIIGAIWWFWARNWISWGRRRMKWIRPFDVEPKKLTGYIGQALKLSRPGQQKKKR